jgi:hypothetical protein
VKVGEVLRVRLHSPKDCGSGPGARCTQSIDVPLQTVVEFDGLNDGVGPPALILQSLQSTIRAGLDYVLPRGVGAAPPWF